MDLKRRIRERRITGVMVEGIYMGKVLRTPLNPVFELRKNYINQNEAESVLLR